VEKSSTDKRGQNCLCQMK